MRELMAFPISQKEGGASEKGSAILPGESQIGVYFLPKPPPYSARRSITLSRGTGVAVSVQHTQQQQRQVIQQNQNLNGQPVVECVTDTVGSLEQTPLERT